MTDKELKLLITLKRIASYMPPEMLRKAAERKYGLEYEEALEMAYENIIQEAKSATRGMRLPKETGQ